MTIGEIITKVALVWSFYTLSVPYTHGGVEYQELSHDWFVRLSILFVSLSLFWDWVHRSQTVIARIPGLNYATWFFTWQIVVFGIGLFFDLTTRSKQFAGQPVFVHAGIMIAMMCSAITAVCEVLGSIQYLLVKLLMTDMRDSYYRLTESGTNRPRKRKKKNGVRVTQFCPVCNSSIHPMVGYCEHCGPYYEYCQVVDSVPCLPCNPKR